MPATDVDTIDFLFEKLGDCGLFQILVVLVLHGSIIPAEWSATFMAYGNYDPGWKCANSSSYSHQDNVTTLIIGNNSTANHFIDVSINSTTLTSCDAYQACKNVVYDQDVSTIVTQWNLDCDRSWITSLMISLHMGGFLVGTYLAGYLNNQTGRKFTHFSSMALHAALNIFAAFSVSWEMFTVLSFLIGITTGAIGVTNFMYPMEFVTSKWRGIVAAIPFSTISCGIFGLAAFAFKDWKILHFAIAFITILFFLPVFWIPESIRWLALKGKTEDAVEIVQTISRMNKTKADDLDVIYTTVVKLKGDGDGNAKGATILDLYRKGFAMRTIIIAFTWIGILFPYTIIFFGIKTLSGNFFINFILFSVIPAFSLPFLPCVINSAGRKPTTIILLGLLCLLSIGLLMADLMETQFDTGIATLTLSLLVIVVIEAHWAIIMLYTVELYPTSLRSVGYSHAICIGRISGMIAPFLIPHNGDSAYISHSVMTGILVINWFIIFFLPETKGKDLDDYVILD